jgi:hypothetical protein
MYLRWRKRNATKKKSADARRRRREKRKEVRATISNDSCFSDIPTTVLEDPTSLDVWCLVP